MKKIVPNVTTRSPSSTEPQPEGTSPSSQEGDGTLHTVVPDKETQEADSPYKISSAAERY